MEKKIVLTSGGFDPLHSGHLAYFEAAKKLGDELWVGVNSDAWLTRKKGRPFMPFAERANLIKNLRMVDQVLSFEDDELGSSNCCIEKVLSLTGANTKIVIANGGDRNPSNIPEVIKYGDHPRVEFAWSVGGDNKQNSSSWILEDWKAPKTNRTWGWYRVLDDQKGYKVKELIIEPGKGLSMQRHFLRSEHWYVLKGECRLKTEYNSIGDTRTLTELTNGYIIAQGVWHQATNLTDKPCHILEVQYGERCIEEDIERRDQ
jgi:cytidyltransferase-like protein